MTVTTSGRLMQKRGGGVVVVAHTERALSDVNDPALLKHSLGN